MHTPEALLANAESIPELIPAYSGDGAPLPRTLGETGENGGDLLLLAALEKVIGGGRPRFFCPLGLEFAEPSRWVKLQV